MDDVKRCSQYGLISLKSNFLRESRSEDGLTPHCKPCQKIYRKKYYNELYDLEINRRRNYRVDNKETMNEYNKKRIRFKL